MVQAFFTAVMNQESLRRIIILNASGTSIHHTSPDRILPIDIQKPSLEEQEQIAQVLDLQVTRIRTEEQYLEKLKLQKRVSCMIC